MALPTVCRFRVRFARVLPLVFVGNGFDVACRTGEKRGQLLSTPRAFLIARADFDRHTILSRDPAARVAFTDSREFLDLRAELIGLVGGVAVPRPPQSSSVRRFLRGQQLGQGWSVLAHRAEPSVPLSAESRRFTSPSR